ncbi:hypothetical protein IGI37_000715 [Enterococcus sp. AZ194]|uniref:hypothetical protein n=1 Tax=Enterococcus sp. AZ194 TaxID=2774629 RepID=UPI003F288199
MKKKLFKRAILLLSLSMLSSASIPVFTYANELESQKEVEEVYLEDIQEHANFPVILDENLNIDSITDFISEQVVEDKNIEFTDDGVLIDGKFYTPDEFDKILETMEDPTEVEIKLTENPNPQTRAFYIPAIGYATTWIYAVPGVGQVAVVATATVAAAYGSYIFGRAVIKSGHWAYTKVRKHVNARTRPKKKSTTTYNYQKSVSKKDYIAYKFKISNKILDGNGNVVIGDFRDKYGKPPRNTDGKSSKRFKNIRNGRYDIQKDKTTHKGRYKLNRDGKRVGTVDGDGRITGD